jgi:hypothetical protein
MEFARFGPMLRPRRNFFGLTVKWITSVRTNPGSSAVTGWREPISISGQGKAAWALYSAGGLVFFGLDSSDPSRRS